MPSRAGTNLSLALAAVFTTVALPAQSRLHQEMAYVRGLVSDLRFVELAQFEVGELKKEYTDKGDSQLVAQLAVEVSLEGARLHPDRKIRRRLFENALTESTRLIERFDGQPVALEARRTLVESCIAFGQLLNEDLELAREEDLAPSAITRLEENAASVFRTGAKAARKVQDSYASLDGEEIHMFVAWMQRGILLREHARAVPKDRGYLVDQATQTLEDLIFEVGEETALGQRALFELAKIAEVVGDHDRAIRNYTDTIDAIWISLTGEFAGDIPQEVQRMMFDMMQEVYDRLAIVLLQEEEFEQIHQAVAQLDGRVKEFQTERHAFFGDSLLLTQARAHAAAKSDVSAALRAAREINDRHPHDFVGLRAKGLIRDILRRSSDLVTGDLLFEVAKGDYQSKEYDAAAAGAKRALRRMDDAGRKALGFEAWTLVARSNEKMRRWLEASLAYTRALEAHGELMLVQDKATTERAARKASHCLRKAATSAGDKTAFPGLQTRIEPLLRRFSPGFATQNDYNRGIRAKAERDYAEAAQHFFRVSPKYDKYELALAHGVLSLYYENEFDQATERIAQLRDHVASHPLDANDRSGILYREQALAWAHYAEGRILYARATGKTGKPDPTKFQDLIQHFHEFENEHAAHANNLMPIVHEILGRMHLESAQVDKALARYESLKRLGESVPNAHRTLGLAILADFDNRIDQLEKTRDALEDTEKATDLDQVEKKLDTVRRRALDVGLDFAKSVSAPYAVLYNLMRIAEDLEDWKRCEWAAEKILANFEDSSRSSLDQVRPVLGQALLRQSGRLREALDVLEAAEKQWTDDPKKPRTTAYYEVLRYKALALGGWPAFDETKIHFAPNPGLSKPNQAYEIMWSKDYRKFALHSKRARRFSLAWYQYHLDLYFFCRQAQPIDSKFEQRADTFYNIARSTDDFATLRRLGKRGRNMATLFRWIGH